MAGIVLCTPVAPASAADTAAVTDVSAASSTTSVPPAKDQAAAKKAPAKKTGKKDSSIFGIIDTIFNLDQEEKEVEREEKLVDQELKKEMAKEPWNLLEEARLMNLKATLRQEEAAIKSEERDAEKDLKEGKDVSKDTKFKKDAERLGRLEKMEQNLRFNSEENNELKDIEKLLPKIKK